jgi:hypothetical protein
MSGFPGTLREMFEPQPGPAPDTCYSRSGPYEC